MLVDSHGNVVPAFAALMVKLASAYPSVRLSELTIRTYAQALADCTVDQLAVAFGTVVRESTYWPTVAEIRKHLVGSAEDAALVAWSALQQAASRIGAYAPLWVEDAAAAEALLSVFGSWPEFCAAEGAELGGRRVEFLAAYRTARRLSLASDRPRMLAGLCATPAGLVGAWAGLLQRSGAVMAVPHDRLLQAGEQEARRALPEAGTASDDGAKGEG